ncbi:MAG: D-2-hydroxyacid dehydrogenase [Acidobacteria bacterium]|nr:D-2-hydroxyacid dehydrogenase [Acidobacteriota bacterium]
MKLKIWSNLPFREDQANEREMLVSSLSDHALSLYPYDEKGVSGEGRERLLEADVVYGWADPDVLIESKNLKWAAIPFAGIEAYDRDDLRENFVSSGKVLTNSSQVFIEPCAEHAAAMILSLARGLPYSLLDQMTDRSWQINTIRVRNVLLTGQKIVIYGYGAIGKRLAELLAPYNMDIVGVRRSRAEEKGVRMTTLDAANAELADAEHVVNIMPGGDTSNDYFDATRFSLMQKGAFYYSIGRGTTTNKKGLIDALNSGHISAAYLDVTDPEPLPPDDPLWSVPNCFITPHIAGGFIGERTAQIEHFLSNLKRFENKERLEDQVI